MIDDETSIDQEIANIKLLLDQIKHKMLCIKRSVYKLPENDRLWRTLDVIEKRWESFEHNFLIMINK